MITYEPLAKTMKERGITLSDILRKMGTDSGTFKRYLNSGRYLSLGTIDKFCKILNCRIEDILLYKEGEQVITEPMLHCHVDWDKVEKRADELNLEYYEIGLLIGKSRTWYHAAKRYKSLQKSNMKALCKALKVEYKDYIIDECK